MRGRFMRLMLSACAGIASLAASAVVQVDIEHDTSGVRLGYWTSDFAAAKAYADANHVPFIGFWGSTGCGYCALMKSTGLISKEFLAWVQTHKVVMCYVEVAASQTSVMTPAKEFMKGSNRSGEYPFMTFYWNKSNGEVVKADFTGRKGDIPPYSKGTLGVQFVAGLDYHFGSYKPEDAYAGGYFSVTNRSATARLEAVAGKTTYVDVPMFRTSTSDYTNKIQVDAGAMGNVAWASKATKASYRCSIPATAKAGSTIALKLYDSTGKTVKSTTTIAVVAEPANSISNPKWIGESFEAGEWTMDLDAALAKAKSATARAYTLAVVGGDLWCPYCQGLRNGVLSKADFTTWAKRNNVNLVTIDMPQKDKTTATLLTRDESAAGASGAAYLSRKMISDSAAQTVFNRNKTLSGSTWLPKSSSATRCGNPTVLLLNPDKTVAARLYSANDGTTYPLEETLSRLNALLGHVGGSDKLTDAATTTLSLAVEGTASGELQVNSNVRWYKLTNVPNGRVTFSSTGGKDRVLTVYEYSGSGACTTVLAAGTNSLGVTFTTTANKYLKVQGFVPGKTAYGSDNTMTYTLSSAVTLVPSQSQASFKTTSGKMNMTVTKGTKYKLSGFTSYAAFTKNSDGTYTANSSGTIAMSSAAGATVTYQIWVSGTIQFATTSASKLESDGSGTISVTRTGGTAGAASVTVSVNKGSSGSGRVTVSPTTLTWADGASGAKTVTYRIAATSAYNPDETFTISLAVASSSAAALGANKTFSLKVSDTDEPVLPRQSYALQLFRNFSASEAYAVSNIRENGRVSIGTAGRLPSGVRVSYDANTKRLVLSGKPTRAGTYEFSVAVSERRSAGISTGPATTFTVTVSDPSKLKPGDKGYNAVLAAGTTVYGSMPLYGTASGRKVMAGVATVKILRTGRMSVNYVGADGVRSTFSGLPTLSADGTAKLVAARGDATATLSVLSTGLSTLSIAGLSTRFGSSLASRSGGLLLTNGDRAAYAGYYTVTLSVAAMSGKTEIATGTGYVILKMNTATFTRTGKVSYLGTLANGTAFSGSAYLSGMAQLQDNAEWAYLPICVAKRGVSAAFVLRVRANAAKTYESNPQVVLAESESTPYMIAYDTFAALNVYGGIYDRNMDFELCCDEYYSTTTFKVAYGTSLFADSARYGAVTTLPNATVTVGERGALSIANADASHMLTLRLAPSTGIVTGRMPVTFANGRRVTLTVKGVLLPGWADCGCFETDAIIERPIFSGAAYYADTIGGISAKRGFSVELQH